MMGTEVQLPAVVDDVADARECRYDVPFKVKGKINRVTFNLGKEKLMAEEQEIVHKALAEARDEL